MAETTAHGNNKSTDQQPLIAAYRHDAHKFTGEPHRTAPDTYAGVSVNQSIPQGADADAAAMSRPSGKPEQTMANHQTHYRLSLLTGESAYDTDEFARPVLSNGIEGLLTGAKLQELHHSWLTSAVASGFNESIYYPYTSLKYHTLLVAALLDNYRDGHDFADLRLIVDDAGDITPHRTVYAGERFTLRIAADAEGNPWARLGSRPWRSWASTWTRLTEHPLDTAREKYDRVLDANLRRIGSWSTALQYIEEFHEWRPDQ